MTFRGFTFNPFATNCWIASSRGRAVILDPSCHTESEAEAVLNYIKREELTVDRILLTHAHIDHIFGCRRLSEAFEIGIEVHRSESRLLSEAVTQGQMFGVDVEPPPEPTGWLEPGNSITFGEAEWEIIHTPGHSPGSVSFVDRTNRTVVSGDVLFAGSIGRTDLWQGSLPVLMQSIFDQLVPLGDDFRVLPGHGPETTIGQERTTNPFLLGQGGLI